MKSEKLYGGGSGASIPKDFYFDGVTYTVTNRGRQEIDLLCKRTGKNGVELVLTIHVNLVTRSFSSLLSGNAGFTIDHLFAVERVLQSSALTHGFPLSQILIPLNGLLHLNQTLELRGNLETFPLPHSSD